MSAGSAAAGARPTMVFHVPFALDPDAKSASGIRPMRMREAFEALGYEVLEVAGRSPERRERMRAMRRRIRDGADVRFVYSEAASTPTGLERPFSSATSFTRDIRFLRFCRRKGIPVGLFYRDIYWQFPDYVEQVGRPLATLLRSRYRADLRGYRKALDRVYLPSMQMAEYLPKKNRAVAQALPPGLHITPTPMPDSPAAMLFVGGLGSYYRMHEALRGAELARAATFTLCAPEAQWEAVRGEYEALIGDSTRVVHASGTALEPLFAEASLGSLFMEPVEYRQFAAPMKLYEYLGHGKPIIATEGSLAAVFVEQHGVGWTVPYDAEALARLRDRLAEHPAEFAERAARVAEVREQHTWEARARQVAEDLSGG